MNAIKLLLPAIGLFASGGGVSWLLIRANARKLNAESAKLAAEASKTEADTDKVRADIDATNMATMKGLAEAVHQQLAEQSSVITRQSNEINELRDEIRQLRANLTVSVNTLQDHIDKLENTVCELGATPPPRPAVPTMIGD